MAFTLPPLTSVNTKYGEKLRYQEGTGFFPQSEWLPTLVKIHQAQNVGDQKEAIGEAAFLIGVYRGVLRPIRQGRFGIDLGYDQISARYRFGEGQGYLGYVAAGFSDEGFRAGYQSVDGMVSNPAFMTLGSANYDRVVAYHPLEDISPAGEHYGAVVIRGLANSLYTSYPGFEIHRKLEEAGVPVIV